MNVWFGSICIFPGQICMSGLPELRCDNAEGYYSRGRGLACAGGLLAFILGYQWHYE